MTILNRINIGLIAAGAGLCGVAIALSAHAAATPLLTGGGYACLDNAAGGAGPVPAAAGAPAVAGMAGAAGAPGGPLCTASAPVADMAGIPMALPGPAPVAAPAPVPLGAPLPLPLGAPVPVVPAAAPVPVGAPVVDMAGGMGGKGDPIQAPAPGAPVSGQPILPGPAG